MTALMKLPRPPAPPGVPGYRRYVPDYGTLRPLKQRKRADMGVPVRPFGFPGSDLEWLVNWWLTQRHIPFAYQQPFLGGRVWKGGQVADFTILDRFPPLIIGVQGEYWHYRTGGLRARALLAKLALQRSGYTVVYVLGADLTTRLDYTMREALRGRQLFED